MKALLNQTLRSFLPKEHGLTAIWLSSTLAGLLTVKEYFDLTRFTLAIFSSVIILFASSSINRFFRLTAQVRRSVIMLLISSSVLTLLTPFNQLIVVGELSSKGAAVWLLLSLYTVLATLSTRKQVRRIVLNSGGSILPLTIGGTTMLASVCSLLVYSGLLPYTTLLSTLTLPASSLAKVGASTPKGVAVRRLGLAHLSGMLAFSIMVSAH